MSSTRWDLGGIHSGSYILVDRIIFPFKRFASDMIKLETLGTFKVHERVVLEFIVFAHNDLVSTTASVYRDIRDDHSL